MDTYDLAQIRTPPSRPSSSSAGQTSASIATFGKRLGDITKADLEQLVINQIPESRTLDFKQEVPGRGEHDLREFAYDVSAFANTEGGLLVYGVSEKRVGYDKTIVPDRAIGLLGLTSGNYEALEQSLTTGVEPRITGVSHTVIDGFPEGPVLLVHVPKSWQAPHMVKLHGANRFFYRTAGGREMMDVMQLRRAFLQSQTFPERVSVFREDRTAKILGGDMTIPLSHRGGVLALFVIPLRAFDMNPLSVSELRQAQGVVTPLGNGGGGEFRWNFDGLAVISKNSYAQIYRSGIIEFTDAQICESGSIPSGIVERSVFRAVHQAIKFLSTLPGAFPVAITMCLLGAESYRLETGGAARGNVGLIDRNVVLLPVTQAAEPSADLPTAVLWPLIDALWQTAGYECAQSYDNSGHYVGW